jgi:predicted Zn finger-like uncharacterized protein
MNVKCEKCRSEFNLSETLLKKEGSTVRCSVCKNIFKVFPPEADLFEGALDTDFSDTAMEETVALDMPPDMEGIEEEIMEEDGRDSFDKAFEEAMEEVIEDEDLAVSDDESVPDREHDTAELHTEKPDTAAVKITGQKKKEKGKPRILLISLSILLFLIIAFLVVFFFFPGVLPDSIYSTPSTTSEPVIDEGVNKLDFEDVNGDFAEPGKAGKLFVIHGSVINNYSKNRSYILLKGGILGKDGKPLKEETAYAGNTLTEDRLKNISAEEIKALMKNRTGTSNNNVDVKPGSAVPFMIIFTDLPDDDKMVDLSVQAVSSASGK